MGKSNLLVLLLAVAIVTSTPEPAHALDNDEHGTPAEISAKLRAEGQQLIAHADLLSEDGRLRAMFFTTNADRSVGYIVQSDRPFGDKGTQFRIYRRMSEIRVFDARVPSPEQVYLKASDAIAQAKCEQLVSSGSLAKGTCVPYNKTLRDAEERGQRPMIQASNVRESANGAYVSDGALITVTGALANAKTQNSASSVVSSIYYSSLPEGATILNATLTYANYEPYGLALLDKKPK